MITRVDRDGRAGGAVGVIRLAPERHDGEYEIQFADGGTGLYRRAEIRSRRRTLDEMIAQHRRPKSFYRERIAYECLVGSKAFGLSNADSDDDIRGFFVAPASDFHGLPQLDPPAQIEGEKDPVTHKFLEGEDWCYWEARKFVEHLLKANPTSLETVYTPFVIRTSPVAEELRGIRDIFLTKQIASTYAGYAISQMAKMEASAYANVRKWEKWEKKRAQASAEGRPAPPEPDVPNVAEPFAYRGKHGMHLIRLLKAGAHALRTGELMVEVPDEIRPLLLDLRHNKPPIGELQTLARSIVREEFDPALETSPLPDTPDYDQANEFLLWTRGLDERMTRSVPVTATRRTTRRPHT